MGTHLRELSESYLMSTKMTALEDFQKSLHLRALDESSLSIGRVKMKVFLPSLANLSLGSPLMEDVLLLFPIRVLALLLLSSTAQAHR